MFCHDCGKEISDGVKFCPHCGKTQVFPDDKEGYSAEVKTQILTSESKHDKLFNAVGEKEITAAKVQEYAEKARARQLHLP